MLINTSLPAGGGGGGGGGGGAAPPEVGGGGGPGGGGPPPTWLLELMEGYIFNNMMSMIHSQLFIK